MSRLDNAAMQHPSQPVFPLVEWLRSGDVSKGVFQYFGGVVSSFLGQRTRDTGVGYPRQGCQKREWTGGAGTLL